MYAAIQNAIIYFWECLGLNRIVWSAGYVWKITALTNINVKKKKKNAEC